MPVEERFLPPSPAVEGDGGLEALCKLAIQKFTGQEILTMLEVSCADNASPDSGRFLLRSAVSG
jgi:hypothetical protein